MLRAPSSIQRYMDQSARTSGFGVTSGSLFFLFIIYFCPPLVLPTSTGHSFRGIWMKLCRRNTQGGIHPLFKNFGGRTPWGKIFSQIFFQDIDLQNCVSHAPDPGKNKQKKFGAPDPPGLRGLASKVVK